METETNEVDLDGDGDGVARVHSLDYGSMLCSMLFEYIMGKVSEI